MSDLLLMYGAALAALGVAVLVEEWLLRGREDEP